VSRNGKQVGDPVRAGEAIIKALATGNPPLHLVLGLIALETTRDEIEKLGEELDAWEKTSLSADYPESNSRLGEIDSTRLAFNARQSHSAESVSVFAGVRARKRSVRQTNKKPEEK